MMNEHEIKYWLIKSSKDLERILSYANDLLIMMYKLSEIESIYQDYISDNLLPLFSLYNTSEVISDKLTDIIKDFQNELLNLNMLVNDLNYAIYDVPWSLFTKLFSYLKRKIFRKNFVGCRISEDKCYIYYPICSDPKPTKVSFNFEFDLTYSDLEYYVCKQISYNLSLLIQNFDVDQYTYNYILEHQYEYRNNQYKIYGIMNDYILLKNRMIRVYKQIKEYLKLEED